MNALLTNQSTIRLHRAQAAHVLLQLHATGQLDNPDMWSWDVLDSLPQWCLQSASKRSELQMCCGALSLAAELRLWIERDLIVAAHAIVGEAVFNAIVATPFLPVTAQTGSTTEQQNLEFRISDTTQVGGATDNFDKHFVDDMRSLTNSESMRVTFERFGASVLKASLPKHLPADLLCVPLGESAFTMDVEQANELLRLATALLHSTSEPMASGGVKAEMA